MSFDSKVFQGFISEASWNNLLDSTRTTGSRVNWRNFNNFIRNEINERVESKAANNFESRLSSFEQNNLLLILRLNSLATNEFCALQVESVAVVVDNETR